MSLTHKERKLIKGLQEELRTARELNDLLRASEAKYKAAAAARLDTQMLDARIKLANSLGQLVEATSKAVMFVIAKETL